MMRDQTWQLAQHFNLLTKNMSIQCNYCWPFSEAADLKNVCEYWPYWRIMGGWGLVSDHALEVYGDCGWKACLGRVIISDLEWLYSGNTTCVKLHVHGGLGVYDWKVQKVRWNRMYPLHEKWVKMSVNNRGKYTGKLSTFLVSGMPLIVMCLVWVLCACLCSWPQTIKKC